MENLKLIFLAAASALILVIGINSLGAAVATDKNPRIDGVKRVFVASLP